ncbi:MAG: cysteine desulfurase family protein [Pseudomonadota bacterium]
MDNNSKIYLDYNATCPPREKIIDNVKELLSQPLNPSSIHYNGRLARNIIEESRKKISNFVDANNNDYNLIFTASGTEATNLALRGLKNHYKQDLSFITSNVEHSATLNTLKELSKNIIFIKIDEKGYINLTQLEQEFSNIKPPFLLSIIYAHNESGIIQPIKEISEITHKYGGILHIDAVQALGKIHFSLSELNIDMASLSGHKVGGIIGAGALIYKNNIKLLPIITGGGQEFNIRAGTENLAAIQSFAMATQMINDNELDKIKELRDYLEQTLQNICTDVIIVGKNSERLGNSSLIITPNINAEAQLIQFDMAGIMISRGSACTSGTIKPNENLLNMGYSKELADCAIRVSIGYNTTKNEIDKFIEIWKNVKNGI